MADVVIGELVVDVEGLGPEAARRLGRNIVGLIAAQLEPPAPDRLGALDLHVDLPAGPYDENQLAQRIADAVAKALR